MPDAQREEMARKRVDEKIKGLAIKIESQYKRTGVLRKALAGVKCSFCRTQDETGSCDLVSSVSRSHKEWKNSDTYKDGIKSVRKWKQSRNLSTGLQSTRNENEGLEQINDDSNATNIEREEIQNIIKKDHTDVEYAFGEDKNTSYQLERDVNGYVIQWKVLKPQEPELPQQNSTSQPFLGPSQGSEKYLEPVNEDASDYRFKGRFPDQRINLQNLLDKKPQKPRKDVILHRERHTDEQRVRYFHIPYNNMEHAIARYFDEESPNLEEIYQITWYYDLNTGGGNNMAVNGP
ncbi:uncharacterized protein ColSpa_04718 [Colletotrichum spaethianum]|uniref:Uncharacterized protein n=1 Tax=Colletotrichum spaethianum TaxID=700344 RepID=A0AA37L9W0_9PEZI|nr:uncharacterized protein ColSpa_04718 [Colletotrichum spaethianum]GKT44537.1 hypothetical protein ColSpa_04718 [Colletotrichum spaethianum]